MPVDHPADHEREQVLSVNNAGVTTSVRTSSVARRSGRSSPQVDEILDRTAPECDQIRSYSRRTSSCRMRDQ